MQRVSTGIAGLDGMLGGGLLPNRIILVRGGPGSGKTIFSLQFLLDGVKKGERGVYMTLEEPLHLIKANMALFGWDLEESDKTRNLKVIDASQLVYKSPSSTRYGESSGLVITQVTSQLKQAVEDFRAKRLVVDPVTSAVIHQRFPTDKRLEILELVKTLREIKCTSIITSEVSSSSSAEGDFYVEEYLADGVIVLSKILENFKMVKTIRVEKMRGLRHDEQPRRYEITENGLTVYDTETVTV